jgi:NAD(P) transhydrogenase subunit beta
MAIIATFFLSDFGNEHVKFWIPFAIGGVIGLVLAMRVSMISMPQLVALLHSFVGLAAVLVSISKYMEEAAADSLTPIMVVESYLGVWIGAVTFTGSIVAFGKLNGNIRSAPLIILGWGRHVINLVLVIICLVLQILFIIMPYQIGYLLGGLAIALFIGWHMIMAIGGADMPVVVSMLNSYSGWATVASGFLLSNMLLIITGALVGSSGAILSYIMCKAMNRSFLSVILGGWGNTAGESSAMNTGIVQETSLKETVANL